MVGWSVDLCILGRLAKEPLCLMLWEGVVPHLKMSFQVFLGTQQLILIGILHSDILLDCLSTILTPQCCCNESVVLKEVPKLSW